jgi:glycosyltransferase involved in cell wall biosynthesis
MHSAAIIVPCYNEAQRLSVDEFVRASDGAPGFDFCFVDDGSTDKTIDVINTLRHGREDRVFALRLPSNQGKAEAVRSGILHMLAQHDYAVVGYWDADASTPLSELPRLLDMISGSDRYVMLSGCRVRRLGAEIHRNWYRHYLGRVFATAVSLMLKLPTYDTQCGAKLFRSQYATSIFEKRFVSRWFFDVELFCRIEELLGRSAAAERILEAPLEAWMEKSGSKLRLRDYVRVPVELQRIRAAYRIGR